jgi:hypothetical protein
MPTVILCKRLIVTDDLVFDAEREVRLPIPPFVGLRLDNSERVPEGCDASKDHIEEVAYDLRTGRILCRLANGDYRPASSGSDDWTEEDVREQYRDWRLERDYLGKPPWTCERN